MKEVELKLNAGDLVKRYDDGGTGTGILYRVLKIGDEGTFSVKRQGIYHRQKTRKIKLEPVIVLFDAKRVTFRQNITHYACDLKKVDIVELGTEHNKLTLLIQDEVRRRVSEPELSTHQAHPDNSELSQ